MSMIKNILKEELRKLLQTKRRYEQELMKLPKGSLVRKKVGGQHYYYLVMRDHGQVKCIYKGKISKEEVAKLKHAKICRAEYRRLLSQVKRQIKFFTSTLHSKKFKAYGKSYATGQHHILG